MADLFQTCKPRSALVRQYVAYYYLDTRPQNEVNRFMCFPHINNTISLYESHVFHAPSTLVFDEEGGPCQVFTPIRDSILTVEQIGPVHRLVIVFHPLGVQQFFRDVDFFRVVEDVEFFNPSELETLFATKKMDELASLMDGYLESRYSAFQIPALEAAIHYVLHSDAFIYVEDVARVTKTSRQYLNRMFRTHLGVSVKMLHQIKVFRKTINKKILKNSDQRLTELAYEFNFSDQSHMNKTFKKFTGSTPSSFFREGTRLGDEDTFWRLDIKG